MIIFCCNIVKDTKDWTPLIASIGSILIGILVIIFGYYFNMKALNSRKTEDEIISIRKKLDEFYGPLLHLRKKSFILYEKFKKDYIEKDKNFRTLIYLIDGNEFYGNEKIILENIISIDEKCANLIHKKAGLVDDAELRDVLLPKATAHFLLMKLAFDGKLRGHSSYFTDLTFPRDLDEKLRQKKDQLESKLKSLT
jgi:hypothetical protein